MTLAYAMRIHDSTKDPNPKQDSEAKDAVSNLTPQAKDQKESGRQGLKSDVNNEDSPVSLPDVEKLIAFAESITLSEQKEKEKP